MGIISILKIKKIIESEVILNIVFAIINRTTFRRKKQKQMAIFH